MMNTSKTVIFFGTDEFSAISLRELIAKGFKIGAVVTKPDSPKGRGRKLTKPVVKTIAEENDIPVWQPTNNDELVKNIAELTKNINEPINSGKSLELPIGVLVSYGRIIPQRVIDMFAPGIVNVHPSLLPKYRGPSPIESAILNGDTETGVTIMQLSYKMDAGPIYSQVIAPLNDTETAPELETRLGELGAQQLTLTLPAIINGTATPTPQDDDSASYCQLLNKNDSQLDTTKLTAEQAERRVRAYISFPKSKTTINGYDIVITKTHITSHGEPARQQKPTNQHAPTSHQSSPLGLPCVDGRYLSIDALIGPSGRQMSAQAFLNGYIH